MAGYRAAAMSVRHCIMTLYSIGIAATYFLPHFALGSSPGIT